MSRSTVSILARLPVGALAALVALFLWKTLCFAPTHGWNEIRLAPMFMWAHGIDPFLPATGGPVTTWLYGPLPLLLHFPSLLADHAGSALVIAAAVNIGITVAGCAAVSHWLPMLPAPDTRFAAFALTLAFWPSSSFMFLQADNSAVAFSLVSMLLLQRPEQPASHWLAALACAAAIACKQTFVSLVVAEVVHLALGGNIRRGITYAYRVALCGLGLLVVLGSSFGLEHILYGSIMLPAAVPLVDSPGGRLVQFWPHLAIQGGVPLVGLLIARRRGWLLGPVWRLPLLAWACFWPLDLLSLLKNGGALNSLHGWQLLLPTAACVMVQSQSWRQVLCALGLVLVAVQMATAPAIWRPQTSHLRSGEFLARSLPGEIYFPWHPLVTFFAERRIDHVEDGLFIHFVAGRILRPEATSAYLPPRFHAIAYLRGELDWGLARSLIPGDATESDFGPWTIYSWEPSSEPTGGTRE